MTENRTPNAEENNEHDEQLAQFTDQLLDGEATDMATITTDNQELRDLQTTVVQMQSAFGREEPSEVMASRIRSTLIAEWQKANSSPRRRWLTQRPFWNTASGRRRTSRLAFTATVLATVVLALVLGMPENSDTLPGAALGNPIVTIVFLGIVLGGVLWWAIRRRS